LDDPVQQAVLEYGSSEILPPVGLLFAAPASLCRPCREPSRARPRGKPGFSTYEGGFGRETDSPLEQAGFEPSVPLVKKSVSAAVGKCRSGRTGRSRKRRPPYGGPRDQVADIVREALKHIPPERSLSPPIAGWDAKA